MQFLSLWHSRFLLRAFTVRVDYWQGTLFGEHGPFGLKLPRQRFRQECWGTPAMQFSRLNIAATPTFASAALLRPFLPPLNVRLWLTLGPKLLNPKTLNPKGKLDLIDCVLATWFCFVGEHGGWRYVWISKRSSWHPQTASAVVSFSFWVAQGGVPGGNGLGCCVSG